MSLFRQKLFPFIAQANNTVIIGLPVVQSTFGAAGAEVSLLTSEWTGLHIPGGRVCGFIPLELISPLLSP